MKSNATLKYCKDLIDSGVPVDSAFKQVVAFEDTLETLATKEELKAEIHLVRQDLKIEMQQLKYFFVKAVVSLIYAPLVVAGLLKWFGKI